MDRLTLGSFSLDPPKGWTLTTVILTGPEDMPVVKGRTRQPTPKRFLRNLVVTADLAASGEGPIEYVARQREALRQTELSISPLNQDERVMLGDGSDALITEQLVYSRTGDLVHQIQLVCVKDSVAYTLIASDIDGDAFEKNRAELTDLLKSFTQAPISSVAENTIPPAPSTSP